MSDTHRGTAVLPRAADGPARSDPRSAISRSLGPHLDQGFRPDIEGLRALAVIAVILFHGRLLGVHGGFVGVDVFFVLSGYLITRLILGELVATGRLRLRAFWGRRARRLLAASALVIVVTAIASTSPAAAEPGLGRRRRPSRRRRSRPTSSSPRASASYFGAQLGQSTPSPLLHFWSLAVEEQFYLCWPPLLVLLTRRPRQYRRLLLTAIGMLGVGGFVLAGVDDAAVAVVGLLPVADADGRAARRFAARRARNPSPPHPGRRSAPALAWVGLAVIVVVCFRFDEQMAWPGTAVLIPVLATMAVIVGGGGERRGVGADAGPRHGRPAVDRRATPTRCTCGTGRSSCSPKPAADR